MCRNGTLYVNEEEDKSSEHDTWERNVALASIRARMEDSTVSNFHNALFMWIIVKLLYISVYFFCPIAYNLLYNGDLITIN